MKKTSFETADGGQLEGISLTERGQSGKTSFFRDRPRKYEKWFDVSFMSDAAVFLRGRPSRIWPAGSPSELFGRPSREPSFAAKTVSSYHLPKRRQRSTTLFSSP
jgi:hypothetical protein